MLILKMRLIIYFILFWSIFFVNTPYSFAKGKLFIKSSVSGAKVYINKKYAGKTPLKNIKLSKGRYKIKIKKLGYSPIYKTIIIKNKKTSRIKVKLKVFAGIIRVFSNKRGSKVRLNNKIIGKTPLVYEVWPGRKKILVESLGYKTYSKKTSHCSR